MSTFIRILAALGLTLVLAAALPALAGPLDLNTATMDDLDGLPGIGPAKARAILDYRTRKGGFRSVDELDEVKGIGAATLSRLRPLVRVGAGGGGGRAEPEAESEAGSERAASTRLGDPQTPPDDAPVGDPGRADDDFDLDLTEPSGRPAQPTGPPPPAEEEATGGEGAPPGRINVNTADEEQLQALPGIGPAKARAIAARRALSGPFRDPHELTEVIGIGEKTFQRLRPLVTVRVDLNEADLQALEAIGVDSASAERLLAWRRQHHAFRRIEDLTLIPGFGEGALETLRPLIWVAPEDER